MNRVHIAHGMETLRQQGQNVSNLITTRRLLDHTLTACGALVSIVQDYMLIQKEGDYGVAVFIHEDNPHLCMVAVNMEESYCVYDCCTEHGIIKETLPDNATINHVLPLSSLQYLPFDWSQFKAVRYADIRRLT